MDGTVGTEGRVRLVDAAVLLAVVLVLGQALTSRSVLGFLPAAVWLVPMWLVWVTTGALSALRPRPAALAGFALATLHGLQHLGHAGALGTARADLAVEVLLLLVLVALPWQYRRDLRRLATHALKAYVREPLPPLPVFPRARPVRREMFERAA